MREFFELKDKRAFVIVIHLLFEILFFLIFWVKIFPQQPPRENFENLGRAGDGVGGGGGGQMIFPDQALNRIPAVSICAIPSTPSRGREKAGEWDHGSMCSRGNGDPPKQRSKDFPQKSSFWGGFFHFIGG